MTHKTNTLVSHCGEHHSFPANKLVPKTWTEQARTSTIRQQIKHEHNKRVRRYYAKLIKVELGL
jgi:hypothetical protein